MKFFRNPLILDERIYRVELSELSLIMILVSILEIYNQREADRGKQTDYNC